MLAAPPREKQRPDAQGRAKAREVRNAALAREGPGLDMQPHGCIV
jgi:hypothetical protein